MFKHETIRYSNKEKYLDIYFKGRKGRYEARNTTTSKLRDMPTYAAFKHRITPTTYS